MFQYLIIIFVSLLASISGSICGIGGGVIIKPVLDSLHIMSVSTVSFLSGFTVLCMSMYSVGRAVLGGESVVRFKTSVPMSAGAVLGGIIGKYLFSFLRMRFPDSEMVGVVQSACLLFLTLGTLVYTLKKGNIKTRKVDNIVGCSIIGLVLGMISAFLGIGGGPFNLVLLSYLFSMETKEAAQNSLFIIMFSQISSICLTIVTGAVPEIPAFQLVVMASMGIIGAALGAKVNQKINSQSVDRLFVAMLVIVMGVCSSNIYHFL